MCNTRNVTSFANEKSGCEDIAEKGGALPLASNSRAREQ